MGDSDANPTRKTVYVSKVDGWIAVLLIAGPMICAILAMMMLQRGQGNQAWICLGTGAATLVITGMFTTPCRYTILSDSLTVRCGVIFFRIPLEQIRKVEKSGSWLSAPALSTKRVKVSTASRYYLISPEDRDRFMIELQQAIDQYQT